MVQKKKIQKNLGKFNIGKIFRKKNPKKMSVLEKTEKAFEIIKANPEEKKTIVGFMIEAFERVERRRKFGATGNYSDDPHNKELTKKTEKVLGKKRAEKFFEYMNNPNNNYT